MRRRPGVSLAMVGYGLIAHVYAFALTIPSLSFGRAQVVCVVFFATSIALSTAEFHIGNAVAYRFVLFVHAVVLLLGRDPFLTTAIGEAVLVCGVLVSIAIYENYPLNLVLCLVLTVMFAIVPPFTFGNRDHSALVAERIGTSLIYLITSFLACILTRYRESLIDTQMHGSRLEQAIGKLTRANQEYQDYVLKIESASADRERKRITSDIHDVVGYTLTNNIMLMEAATDLARSDPIKVTKLLSTARENAQEGLERIRESLHSFRKRSTFAPYGLSAVVRLVETFRLATDIEVHTEFGNAPNTVDTETDAAVYHVVQESMVNSLRHGRATRITVLMYAVDSQLHLDIRDNGSGVDAGGDRSDDGIGLKGMAERVERLGGTLSYGSVVDGFRVSAMIPVGSTRAERGGIGHGG